MAVIVVNGCFDILHQGHTRFLIRAKHLGTDLLSHNMSYFVLKAAMSRNRLIVALNSDDSARQLKAAKWGEKYPIDNQLTRMQKLVPYADEVVVFDSEDRLHELIEFLMPCILVKGPDYEGKVVNGDDIAPVIILDTPEPESVKEMKRKAYEVTK